MAKPPIIASTKKNPWVDSWMVAGTSGHEYEVSRRADGVTYGCKCKTWLYAPAPKPDCQHILKKKLELAQAELKKAKSQPKPSQVYVLPVKSQPGQIVEIDSPYDYNGSLAAWGSMSKAQQLADDFGLNPMLGKSLIQGVSQMYKIHANDAPKVYAIKWVMMVMKTTPPYHWGLLDSKNFVDAVVENNLIQPLTPVSQHGSVTPVKQNKAVEYEGRIFRGEDD